MNSGIIFALMDCPNCTIRWAVYRSPLQRDICFYFNSKTATFEHPEYTVAGDGFCCPQCGTTIYDWNLAVKTEEGHWLKLTKPV